MFTITLADGSKHLLEAETNIELVHGRGTYGNGSIDWEAQQLALRSIAEQLGYSDALAAEVDGELKPMDAAIKKDCTIRFIDRDDARGQELILRTGAFYLAYGLAGCKDGVQRAGGGVDGATAYYDILTPAELRFTPEDVQLVEEKINLQLRREIPIVFRKMPYYTVVRELTAQKEDCLRERVVEQDNGGPVWMHMCGDFGEPYQGMVLQDSRILEEIKIVAVEKRDFGYRFFAKVQCASSF